MPNKHNYGPEEKLCLMKFLTHFTICILLQDPKQVWCQLFWKRRTVASSWTSVRQNFSKTYSTLRKWVCHTWQTSKFPKSEDDHQQLFQPLSSRGAISNCISVSRLCLRCWSVEQSVNSDGVASCSSESGSQASAREESRRARTGLHLFKQK